MFAAFQLQLSFAILSCQGGLDLSTHFAKDKEEEAEKEETAEDVRREYRGGAYAPLANQRQGPMSHDMRSEPHWLEESHSCILQHRYVIKQADVEQQPKCRCYRAPLLGFHFNPMLQSPIA